VRALWNPTKGRIHPVGQIYLMGVGYVQLDKGAMLLEPDRGTEHVRLVRYVRSGVTVTVLEPNWGSDKFNVSNMSNFGSDVFDQEPVPQFQNLMEISYQVLEPDGIIQPGQICPTRQRRR
jgi:hypothetical protein